MLDDLITRHLDYHQAPQPVTAMEIDYPDGASTGLHAHPRAQLLHAIQGVMIVRSRVGTWIVPPNRAVWLIADLDHEVRMCGAVKIRTVFVAPDAAPDLPASNCVIEVSPLLRELLIAAVDVPPGYTAQSRDGQLMRLLLEEMRRLEVLPLHLPTPGEPRIRAICDAIVAQPHDASTAGQWAARLGVTPKTVHRLFRQQTGLSFGQWRQQARLLQALERLARGERVIDVAAECGYASQSAFAAMFRKQFGVPPGAFYR